MTQGAKKAMSGGGLRAGGETMELVGRGEEISGDGEWKEWCWRVGSDG